jgi:glycerol-3-phosphate acyltransferase PlsX
MRIAIDAMGGDQAPAAILAGAIDGLSLLDPGDELILVGDESIIKSTLGDKLTANPNVKILHASQVITMNDHPVEAVRGKRDSSIVKMVKLAREGGADAIISAGNTGALVASGVLMLKSLAGVERPGIAVLLPALGGKAVMMCDAGANAQSKATHLHQYAVMCSLYMQALRGITNARVGILNVGTEEEKGTPLVKEARELITADKSLNFIGYVEGRDIHKGVCDVLVTDGFTGNVTLKVIEGWSEGIFTNLKSEIKAESPELIDKLRPVMARVMKLYDHEEYGGALLLGVAGIFFKVHGSASGRAIKNVIGAAKAAGKLDVNKLIEQRLGAAS